MAIETAQDAKDAAQDAKNAEAVSVANAAKKSADEAKVAAEEARDAAGGVSASMLIASMIITIIVVLAGVYVITEKRTV